MKYKIVLGKIKTKQKQKKSQERRKTCVFFFKLLNMSFKKQDMPKDSDF